MGKVSIWKRFGEWISRTNEATTGVDVVSVDAEHLAINDSPAEKKLMAIEDGFNRLVDIMGQVNENLMVQRRNDEQQQSHVEPIAELMRQFPTVVQAQSELVDKLAEQMVEQAQQYEEWTDTIKTLPEQAQAQVEQLGDITRKLESSGQTESQMLENLKSQSLSLANVGQLLEKNDQRLQAALDSQQRHLRRLFWAAMGLSAIALALAAAAWVWINIR